MPHFARRLLLLVIAGWLANGSLAAGSSKVTWQTDLKQAVHEAGRAQKPLLVEFTASWCGYCRKMKQTTFADERIARHVNGCFVPVSVDADQNGRLMRSVGVEALPTTVILSHDLRVVRRIAGYQTPAQLEEHLGAICVHEEAELTPVSIEPVPEQSSPGTQPSVTPPAAAQPATAQPQPLPWAFDRVCLVSLLDDHRLRTGRSSLSVTYRGQRLCFATAEHVRRFEQNPELYWPVLDGHCVVSQIDEELDHPGRGREALVYRNRIWLFADRERRNRFYKNAAEYADVLDAMGGETVQER
jgi:thiol-disulfide isomerase/thioredoxin/YHS domain-containing protein